MSLLLEWNTRAMASASSALGCLGWIPDRIVAVFSDAAREKRKVAVEIEAIEVRDEQQRDALARRAGVGLDAVRGAVRIERPGAGARRQRRVELAVGAHELRPVAPALRRPGGKPRALALEGGAEEYSRPAVAQIDAPAEHRIRVGMQ